VSGIGWNPGPTVALVVERLRQRLGRFGAAMEGHCKQLVSRPNTPVRGPKGGKARGMNPSKPGEPPKKVFGQLRSGIAFQIVVLPNILVLRFGVMRSSAAIAYAAALEFGFHGARHVAAHVRMQGPGFKVTGRTARTRRFAPKLGPARQVNVGGFVRAYMLEARPYVRPTAALFFPRLQGFLAGGAS
jgi:hypothetical protein